MLRRWPHRPTRGGLSRLGRRHGLQPISRYGVGDEANEGGAELGGVVDAVGVAHLGNVLNRSLEPESDNTSRLPPVSFYR